MEFLKGLFQSKQVEVKRNGPFTKVVNNTGRFYESLPYSSAANKWDLDRSLDWYDKVIWIFKCVDVIAANQANLPVYLHKEGEPKNEHVEMEEVINILNFNANPHENAWDFRYRLSSQLLLSPTGAFIELQKNKLGNIVAAYLLDPGSVRPIKSAKKFVDHYMVRRPVDSNNSTGTGNSVGGEERVNPDNMMWLRTRPHPTDPYRNVTPLTSAGIAAETDYYARMYNRNFLKNDGRPGMMVFVNGDLSGEDAKEIQNSLSGGYANSGTTLLLEAESADVVDLAANPRDAQWDLAIKGSKDDILLAFGCPESVLGNASGRCLRASENVHLADGSIKRAEQLVGQTVELMQTYDGENKAVTATVDYALKEKIYRLTTFSGRTIETNGEHPLFMATSVNKGRFKREFFSHGWTPMKAIRENWLRHDAEGDGSYTEVAIPLHFNDAEGPDHDFDQAFTEGAARNKVPAYIFKASSATKQAFISGLFSEHGRLSQHTALNVTVPTQKYARDLQIILQRLGVNSVVHTKKLDHVVSIGGKKNIIELISQVDLEGDAAEKALAVYERLDTDKSRELNSHRSDYLPQDFIWDRVVSVEEIGVDQTVAITINSGDNSYLSTFLEHNTYDNAENEISGWWTGTMKTHCESLARGLEPLSGDKNDKIRIKFDYSSVDVLQRIERRRQDNVRADWVAGALSLDEYLKELGVAPLETPESRSRILPNGLVIAKDDADREYMKTNTVILQVLAANQQQGNAFGGGITGGTGVIGGQADMVQGALASGGSEYAAQTTNRQAARTVRSASQTGTIPQVANPGANSDIQDRISHLINKVDEPKIEVKQIDTKHDPYSAVRGKMQGFIEGTLDSWSNRQLNVVSDRIEHVKVRKGTRHWDGETKESLKPLDTDYIVVSEEWSSDVQSNLLPAVTKNLMEHAHSVASNLKEEGVIVPKIGLSSVETILGSDYRDQIKSIAEYVVDHIVESAQGQTELVTKHIGILDSDNRSIVEIKATLNDETFDRDKWAVDLAKASTTTGIEDLNDLLYSNVDGKVYKIWCTATNEYYDPTHFKLNGVKLSLKDNFVVNGAEVKYPSNDFGEDHGTCSCWLYYGVDR